MNYRPFRREDLAGAEQGQEARFARAWQPHEGGAGACHQVLDLRVGRLHRLGLEAEPGGGGFDPTAELIAGRGAVIGGGSGDGVRPDREGAVPGEGIQGFAETGGGPGERGKGFCHGCSRLAKPQAATGTRGRPLEHGAISGSGAASLSRPCSSRTRRQRSLDHNPARTASSASSKAR